MIFAVSCRSNDHVSLGDNCWDRETIHHHSINKLADCNLLLFFVSFFLRVKNKQRDNFIGRKTIIDFVCSLNIRWPRKKKMQTHCISAQTWTKGFFMKKSFRFRKSRSSWCNKLCSKCSPAVSKAMFL